MAGYAAAAWSFIFAAISFYWAAGGSLLVGTVVDDISVLGWAGAPWFIALTGVMKVVPGVLALALVQPWGWRFPRRLLLIAGWGTGVMLTLYGLANVAQHALTLAGVVALPQALSETLVRWHLVLWDPWWLLGGLLFLAATWRYQRTS